jgi:hypothetical protein
MPAGIFLLRGDNELFELNAQPYPQEDLLQDLLARYPNLLAGDQMNPPTPRRWLLVRREAPVPDVLDGAGRWSLDHLFLDQDGVPTLVEVKRSSDTRARREVVAQMLDYAANGVAYWPVETIRAAFEQRAEAEGQDSFQLLLDFIAPEEDSDAFWAKVKVNLQAGRVRMVFVSDEIAPELRRIVEFLNVQMDPAEVLAVEVKQYVGADFRGLVPRLVGQTAEATQRKAVGTSARSAMSGRTWNEASFFEALRAVASESDVVAARALYDAVRAIPSVLIEWGAGGQYGSIHFGVPAGRKPYKFLYLKTEAGGLLQLNLQDLSRFTESESLRAGWVQRLNRVAGMEMSLDQRYPNRSLTLLRSEDAQQAFRDSITWLVQSLTESLNEKESE